jgi:hypothetical protein
MRRLLKHSWLLGCIALTAWSHAASQRVEARPPDQATLQKLLTAYREWGLPLPPPDAPLVLFETGTTRQDGFFAKREKLYALAFRLKPAVDKYGPLLLVGTRECKPEYPGLEVKVVEPDSKLAERSEPRYFYPVFEINAAVATAVQCESRGWHELAEALHERGLRQSAGHPYGMFCQPADQPPRTALAFVAWMHWGNELAQPHSDRAKIYSRMKQVLAVEPKLRNEWNELLLRRLESALKPSAAKAGSPVALIDELAEVSNPEHSYNRDLRYRRLVQQGFDAIPELIQHLTDERLTRAVFEGLNNFAPRFYLIRDFTSEIIRGFADEDLLLDRRRGVLDVWVSRKTASKWWERARKEGERTYLLRTVFPKEYNGKYPREQHITVLAAKYPRDLVQVYETILKDRPDTYARSVIDALAECSLPREQKLELLRKGASHPNRDIRARSEYHLRKLSG